MKASGPREERETVLVMDEDGKTASLWTASEVIYRRMLKRGWLPKTDDERHATFEFPREQFKLPRKKSTTKGFAGRGKANDNTTQSRN